MKKPIIIILFGKSGSGKGTQAKLLQKKFNLDYIGSGDLLRTRAQKKDFVGKKIAAILSKGGLIPTPAILKLWFDRVEELKNKKENFNGVVMDGNPRKILEAYLIDEAFEFYEWDKNVKIVLIDISDKEAIWRLTKRRMCKKCKKLVPFIGHFREIKKCPECGGSLIKRNDDTPGAAKKRLDWFKADVQPILDYYRRGGRLLRVDGEQSIEDVFKAILGVIK